jgi:hypothetical protein
VRPTEKLAEAALYKTNFIKQKWIEDRFMRLDCKQVRIPPNEKQAAMDGLVSNLNLPRILVVEDDPLNQVVFEAALEGAGFQVMLASHADEAAIKLKLRSRDNSPHSGYSFAGRRHRLGCRTGFSKGKSRHACDLHRWLD